MDKDETLSTSPFFQNVELYKTYLGNYKSKTDTLNIYVKNDKLFLQRTNSLEDLSILPVDKKSFISMFYFFYYLNFDKNDKVIGLTRRFGDNFVEYTKFE